MTAMKELLARTINRLEAEGVPPDELEERAIAVLEAEMGEWSPRVPAEKLEERAIAVLGAEMADEDVEPVEVVVSTEETFGDHSLLPAAFDWDEYASRLQEELGDGYRVRLERGPAPLNAGTGDWVADDEIYSRMCAVLDSYVLELDVA